MRRHADRVEKLQAVERVDAEQRQRRFDKADPADDLDRDIFGFRAFEQLGDGRFRHQRIAGHGIDHIAHRAASITRAAISA